MRPRILYVKVEGLTEAYMSFHVSAGTAWKHLDEIPDYYAKKVEAKKQWLFNNLHLYPQTMEYIVIWFLGVAPKYVVDHIVRHRHATWMVSSVRHGDPVRCEPPEDSAVKIDYDPFEEYRRCLAEGGRKEICARLIPPLYDCRLILGVLNLRELAHMYCYRRWRGGQKETVEFLEELVSRVGEICEGCRKAVKKFCYEWGYAPVEMDQVEPVYQD